MVEAKDLILIGAVGAAGILGYKAIKGGLSSVIPSVTIPEQKTTVDYDLSEQFGKLLEDNRAGFADILKQLQSNTGGSSGGSTTIINLPGTTDTGGDGNGNGGDGSDYSLKEISGIADAATFALEKSGAYGGLRKTEAAAAEAYDTNNTAALNAAGGLGGIIGLGDAGAKLTADLAKGVGLTPAASVAASIPGALFSGITNGNGIRSGNATYAIGKGIVSAGETVYDFFKGLF